MDAREFSHNSVLLNETIDAVLTDLSGIYIDCTLGGGGHSAALSEKLGSQATIVGIDQDADALQAAKERLAGAKCRVLFAQGNFSSFDSLLDSLDIEKIDGVIFDLGVSSYQLDTPERGFSYMHDGPLDMRMDKSGKLTARTVVNEYSQERLYEIIKKYGEERWAKRVAEFIVKERSVKPLDTTYELVDAIKKAIPKGARKDGPHPAKRTFQAIRIEVNKELEILENAFKNAVERLKPGGRIGIITFHSLEDRIAKKTLAELGKGCTCPPTLPICVCGKKSVLKSIKALTPSEKELEKNPRARSARLRTATKI